MNVRSGRMLVWALAMLCRMLAPSQAEGNIGCLFSQTVCTNGVEWCYDDFAFGKCIPIYEDSPDEPDLFQYNMSSDELKSFERELQELVQKGYRWEHAYTQCVLQAMLYSSRYMEPFELDVCEPFVDPNIISVSDPKEVENEDEEQVEPEELAYIRFTPNSVMGDSDFANEVYAPPLTGDSETGLESILEGENDKPGELSPLEVLYAEPRTSERSNEKYRQNFRDIIELMPNEKVDDINEYPSIFSERNAEQMLHAPYSNYIENPLEEAKDDDNIMNFLNLPERKYKKSYNPIEELDDNNNPAIPIIINDENTERDLENLKNSFEPPVDPYYQSTVEYLTMNRIKPEELQILSEPLEKYRHDMKLRQLPYMYYPDGLENDIPDRQIFSAGRISQSKDPDRNEFSPLDFIYKDLHGNGDKNTYVTKDDASEFANIWKHRVKNLEIPEPMNRGPMFTEGGLLFFPQTDDLSNVKTNGEFQGFSRRERLDVKKPGPRFDIDKHFIESNLLTNETEVSKEAITSVKKEIAEDHDHSDFNVDPDYAYVEFSYSFPTWQEGADVVKTIAKLLDLEPSAFTNPGVVRNEVTFRVESNSRNMNAMDVAKGIEGILDKIKEQLKLEVISAGIGNKAKYPVIVRNAPINNLELVTVLAAGTIVIIIGGACLFMLMRRESRARLKLQGLATAQEIDSEATQDYQDLCRARMSSQWQTQQQQAVAPVPGPIDASGVGQRITSLSRESDGNSPSTRSSTSSWSEEPALTNMDISTGHMVLAYMEDHLKNKDRLDQEWQGLCSYEAEPCSTVAALQEDNVKKNNYPDILPYDHSRVTLNTVTNHLGSDYINASTITDHDPRNPAYIAAQGPMPHTAPDFWQMVWEQGSVVMVMLTRLTENGVAMCHRYWPEEGSELYHIYEVHLVSEHIWCDDYLVRSFYLKNQKTGETRTVTQFHFLSWPDNGVPSSTKALLEFRRKVNKSYRGRSCPIVVHCSDGASRTGTYCLIDMVLNRMAKGAKEIDIAATLEHIRDQRPHMVTTKQQFEFVLMAVAEEVHAILKALPAQLQQQHEKREKEMNEKDK